MAALWPSKFPLEHLAEASENDKTVFSALYMGRPSPEEGDYFKTEMLVGYNDVVWIPPDIVWRRCETDVLVDEMLDQMRRHKPLVWFAERDHISKSIGPFLTKRMAEEGLY